MSRRVAESIVRWTGEEGLPLGTQLIGRPEDEGTLLALSAQLESLDVVRSSVRRFASSSTRSIRIPCLQY